MKWGKAGEYFLVFLVAVGVLSAAGTGLVYLFNWASPPLASFWVEKGMVDSVWESVIFEGVIALITFAVAALVHTSIKGKIRKAWLLVPIYLGGFLFMAAGLDAWAHTINRYGMSPAEIRMLDILPIIFFFILVLGRFAWEKAGK